MKGLIGEEKVAGISYGNTPEISTCNTPKSPDFQGKSRFLRDITLPEISIVEISGGNKKLISEKFGWRKCILHLNSIS